MKSKEQQRTVSDYVTLVRGTTYKGNLVGEPGPALLGLGSIEPGGGFREGHYKTYGGDCPRNLMLFPGDLYVSLKGATKDGTMIGSIARVPHTIVSGRLTQDTVKLEFRNPEPEAMSYLYWLLRTPHYRTYCAKRATGSAVVALSRQDFLGYPVPLLNSSRKQLVNLFECLDAKIENLRRQNETLERIAQTLFKHWFIDFEFPNEKGEPYRSSGGAMQPSELGEIPAGWRVGQLGDEFNILMGQSPVGSSYNEDGEGLIFFQGRTDFGFRFPKIRLFTTEPKRIANKFNVLVSVRAPVGDINVAFEKCCIGRGLSAISSNYKSYCLYKLKSFKKFFDVFESEGTVFGSLNKKNFNELESLIPTVEILEIFETIVSPIDRKIFINEQQIQTLTKTRDTLLPKLMSGKLRVTE